MDLFQREVLAAEAELYRTLLERDVAGLDRLLADDVLYIGPDGARSDKEADLRFHRSGAVIFEEIRPEDTEVRLLSPDVALLRVRLHLRLFVDGLPHESTYRYLRLYARRDGRWQVVFAQSHVN